MSPTMMIKLAVVLACFARIVVGQNQKLAADIAVYVDNVPYDKQFADASVPTYKAMRDSFVWNMINGLAALEAGLGKNGSSVLVGFGIAGVTGENENREKFVENKENLIGNKTTWIGSNIGKITSHGAPMEDDKAIKGRAKEVRDQVEKWNGRRAGDDKSATYPLLVIWLVPYRATSASVLRETAKDVLEKVHPVVDIVVLLGSVNDEFEASVAIKPDSGGKAEGEEMDAKQPGSLLNNKIKKLLERCQQTVEHVRCHLTSVTNCESSNTFGGTGESCMSGKEITKCDDDKCFNECNEKAKWIRSCNAACNETGRIEVSMNGGEPWYEHCPNKPTSESCTGEPCPTTSTTTTTKAATTTMTTTPKPVASTTAGPVLSERAIIGIALGCSALFAVIVTVFVVMCCVLKKSGALPSDDDKNDQNRGRGDRGGNRNDGRRRGTDSKAGSQSQYGGASRMDQSPNDKNRRGAQSSQYDAPPTDNRSLAAKSTAGSLAPKSVAGSMAPKSAARSIAPKSAACSIAPKSSAASTADVSRGRPSNDDRRRGSPSNDRRRGRR